MKAHEETSEAELRRMIDEQNAKMDVERRKTEKMYQQQIQDLKKAKEEKVKEGRRELEALKKAHEETSEAEVRRETEKMQKWQIQDLKKAKEERTAYIRQVETQNETLRRQIKEHEKARKGAENGLKEAVENIGRRA